MWNLIDVWYIPGRGLWFWWINDEALLRSILEPVFDKAAKLCLAKTEEAIVRKVKSFIEIQ